MSEVLFKISSYDMTKYVVKSTYDINSEPEFESWRDGNFREHRIYVRDRIKGSFDVIFFGSNNTPYNNFITRLSNATSNRLSNITVYVGNEASLTQIQAYIHITAEQHAICDDGRVVNKMTLNIEEY